MNYILISIIALVIIFGFFVFVSSKKKPSSFSPIASFAFLFIIAGIVWGDNKILGYSLLGLGVILAVYDIIIKLKNKNG